MRSIKQSYLRFWYFEKNIRRSEKECESNFGVNIDIKKKIGL
jgi:hypothetical protein